MEITVSSSSQDTPTVYENVSRYEDLDSHDDPVLEFAGGEYTKFSTATVIEAEGDLIVGTLWNDGREKYRNIEQIGREDEFIVLEFSGEREDVYVQPTSVEWIKDTQLEWDFDTFIYHQPIGGSKMNALVESSWLSSSSSSWSVKTGFDGASL